MRRRDEPTVTSFGDTPMTPGTFSVLFVCRENVCRSQFAEHLTRRALQEHLGQASPQCVLSSAGTETRPDTQLHPLTRQVLLEKGIALPAVPAQRLDGEMVLRAELVLTSSRVERSRVVQVAPTSVQYTFTIAQFARYCRASAAQHPSRLGRSGAELLAMAQEGRSLVQPAPDDDDIDDPVNAGIAAFHQCADRIEQEMLSVIRLLALR